MSKPNAEAGPTSRPDDPHRAMRWPERAINAAALGSSLLLATSASSGAYAQDSSTEALAKASQNPVADLISVPFQYNANFNTGPFDRTQHVLNIQPVLPMKLSSEWNIISRTIIPLIGQPDPFFDSSTEGIGDISESLFLSPAHPGQLTWGVGPIFTMPSANHPLLGTGKVLLGPTAVALVMPGHWVIGALVNNQWSVAGDSDRKSVNSFLAQPFINYNFPDGWYVTVSPIVTADWTAPSGQQWTVPLGGGIGRVFKIGPQPVNAQLSFYDNVVHPDGAADWQLRFQFALLFPEK